MWQLTLMPRLIRIAYPDHTPGNSSLSSSLRRPGSASAPGPVKCSVRRWAETFYSSPGPTSGYERSAAASAVWCGIQSP